MVSFCLSYVPQTDRPLDSSRVLGYSANAYALSLLQYKLPNTIEYTYYVYLLQCEEKPIRYVPLLWFQTTELQNFHSMDFHYLHSLYYVLCYIKLKTYRVQTRTAERVIRVMIIFTLFYFCFQCIFVVNLYWCVIF